MAVANWLRIELEPLTAEAFAPFGRLLACPPGPADFTGNCSESWTVPYEAAGGVQINLARFFHQPMRFSRFERHLTVTQGFVPLGGVPCVLVVAPPSGDLRPDAAPAGTSVRAFYMDGSAGVLLHTGTWHTLDRYPVRPPGIDMLFLTDRTTHEEFMAEKRGEGPARFTHVVDLEEQAGVHFEVVGLERFTG